MNALTTSSTSHLSAWIDPKPELDGIALIDHLFNKLDGLYPHRWRSAFTCEQSIENWREAWAEGLADESVTMKEIKRGLKACRRFDWPPSFAEFFSACRPETPPESDLLCNHEENGTRCQQLGVMGQHGVWYCREHLHNLDKSA